MLRRFATMALFLSTVVACTTADTTTTFYIVRHTEKVDQSDESGLTALGQMRAADLAQLLEMGGVNRVYATRYRRTQLTVEPTARRLGLRVTPETPTADELLSRHRGQTILIAGHSNTVPALLSALGIAEEITLASGDYGDLFVVRVTGGRVELERRRFGDPAP